VAFEEILSEFLDDDDFAVKVTYNGSTVINGIFDKAYVEAAETESYRPILICEEIIGMAQGDTILIDSDSYEIVNVRPDGTGLVTLILKKT
jgi:hypothetical protein